MHTGARARKQKYISIYISLYMYIYKQIHVIHRWIQNSAQQLRSGLTVNRLLNMGTYGFLVYETDLC